MTPARDPFDVPAWALALVIMATVGIGIVLGQHTLPVRPTTVAGCQAACTAAGTTLEFFALSPGAGSTCRCQTVRRIGH